MSIEMTLNLLWAEPTAEWRSLAPAIERCMNGDLADPEAYIEFDKDATTYRLTEASWDAPLLTGTIFRVRDRNLPPALRAEGTVNLPIGDDTNLGEPMCFCYDTRLGVAAIQYSHSGPRWGRLGNAINRMGFEHPIYMAPVLTEDAMERLENANIVRRLEFGLKDPNEHMARLRAIGGPVAGALNSLEAVEGTRIVVQVTMTGATGGLQRVKSIVRRLSEIGDTVTRLKVFAKENEDAEVIPIDFINDRIHQDVEVLESGRYLDRADCTRKLRGFLNRNRAFVQRMRDAEDQ